MEQEIQIDPDTQKEYQMPLGMEKYKQRTDGTYHVNITIPHFIIKKHQEEFPDLAQYMKNHPTPINAYVSWLLMIPLKIRNKLDYKVKKDIMKKYKLVK